MAKTYEELLEQAAIIRDETAAGKNTATRVGGTITDAVDYVKKLQDTYAGIHAEAAEAKTEAAAAKLTAEEAKTNAGSARSIAQSAVLTANAAKATADAAKSKNEEQDVEIATLHERDTALDGKISALEAKDIEHNAAIVAIQGKDATQDGKISSLEAKDATHDTKIAKLEERALQYIYPKIYQLNEGAGARVFNGFTEATGEGGIFLTKDTYRYRVLYSTTQKQFVLNVTDEASGVGVRVGTFAIWAKISLPNNKSIASSESYAQRDCLYYIFVDGEGSTYYYIDSNGVASEKSATYLLRLLANKNAADIATLGTTAENAQNAATAANTKITELAGKVNGKQDALTLTVKDNGNIVLANIQGQSKEFMPATPSGDPMHYAFVTAGAEYNDTGADIVKDAPWADLADDDADKTVVHKAGYWYLNGLGDITNEQMQRIYMLTGSNQNYWDKYCNGQDLRTNILTIRNIEEAPNNIITAVSGLRRCSIEVLKVWTDVRYKNISVPYFNLFFVEKLKFIIGVFKASNQISGSNIRNLKGIKIFGIYTSATFSDAKNLSMKSVLYMISNEAATSPITITLHADVYNKCMSNEDILAALAAHTNISIASA